MHRESSPKKNKPEPWQTRKLAASQTAIDCVPMNSVQIWRPDVSTGGTKLSAQQRTDLRWTEALLIEPKTDNTKTCDLI